MKLGPCWRKKIIKDGNRETNKTLWKRKTIEITRSKNLFFPHSCLSSFLSMQSNVVEGHFCSTSLFYYDFLFVSPCSLFVFVIATLHKYESNTFLLNVAREKIPTTTGGSFSHQRHKKLQHFVVMRFSFYFFISHDSAQQHNIVIFPSLWRQKCRGRQI